MDQIWWDHYRPEVDAAFFGDRYSHGHRKGVTKIKHPYMRTSGQNSGAGAIAIAHHFGAERVILLGYDCQKTEGRSHWHGDHPAVRIRGARMGNAGSLDNWPQQFNQLLRHVSGMEIINCSRETALRAFWRARLEDVL